MKSRHTKLPFFFFNDTATTEIYTLSLHDALPICATPWRRAPPYRANGPRRGLLSRSSLDLSQSGRSEEHTSELQSRSDLVCRLLLEKKKKTHAPIRARQQTAQSGTSSLAQAKGP